MFETPAAQELAALLPVFCHGARLYHLRTHDGLEIDARPIERWFDLSTPDDNAQVGIIIYTGSTVKRISRRVWAVPLV